jgi:hypothetical protein
VLHEAHTRDPAADDEDIGATGQLARVALGWPLPERSQFRGPNNIEIRYGF